MELSKRSRVAVLKDAFVSLFQCQTLVVLRLVHYLQARDVFACMDVSKHWHKLWRSDFVWHKIFNDTFFATQLRDMDERLCRALFPHTRHLALDMYVSQAAVNLVVSHEDLLSPSAPPPDFTRLLQMRVAFIVTLQTGRAVAPHCAPKNDLERVLQLSERWPSVKLADRNVHSFYERDASLRVFIDQPPWLQGMVNTVTYQRVAWTTREVTVTFECLNRRYLMSCWPVAVGCKLRLRTLVEDGKIVEERVTCPSNWSERISGAMQLYVDARAMGGLQTTVDARAMGGLQTTVDEFEAQVAHQVWKSHPVNKLSRLGVLLPCWLSDESARWWFARFVHCVFGTWSPYDDMDIGPPSLGVWCPRHSELGDFINYHKGYHH